MLPERYTVENVKRAIQEPSRLVSEFQRIYTSSVLRLNSIYFKRRHGSGLDVTQKDWDNLILLDACRYDFFKTCIEEVDIEGDLQPVISAGSQSWEFMNNTFENETFHDTVYVTANPHVDLLSNETFFKTYPLLEEWNDDAETVLPEDVANAAYDAHNENPNKKLIVDLPGYRDILSWQS